MQKLTANDIKIKSEGAQLKSALFVRCVNLFNIYEFLEVYKYSPSTVNMHMRSKRLDENSKFIKSCEIIIGLPYRTIVDIIPAQLRRYTDLIKKNSLHYDTPDDLKMLDKLKQLSLKYGDVESSLDIDMVIALTYYNMGESSAIDEIINIAHNAHSLGLFNFASTAICCAAYAKYAHRKYSSSVNILKTHLFVRTMATATAKAEYDLLLGKISFGQEKWQESINYLESAYRNFGDNPKRIQASIFIGRCHVKNGDIEKGLNIHFQTLKDGPVGEYNALLHMYISRSLIDRSKASEHLSIAVNVIMNFESSPDTILDVLNDYYKLFELVPQDVLDFTFSAMRKIAHVREKSHLVPSFAQRMLDASHTNDRFNHATQSVGDLIEELNPASSGDKETSIAINKLFLQAIRARKYWFK